MKQNQDFKHTPFIYGAVFLLMAGIATAGSMMLLYISNKQLAVDGVFQELARSLRTAWLDGFFRAITITGETIPVIVLTIIIAVILVLGSRKIEAAMLSIYMLAVWRLNVFLKLLVQRPRPDISLHLTDVSSYSGGNQFSMPSGHSMNLMALLLISVYFLWVCSKNKKLNLRLTILVIAYGIIVGLSRVYLNVHYISDVIAGWGVAAACSAAAIMLHMRIRGK